MGCCVARKWRTACLFLDESQQPTWPHSMHMRSCSQVSRTRMQSSQPEPLGHTLRIRSTCEHVIGPSGSTMMNGNVRTPLLRVESIDDMSLMPVFDSTRP